MNPGFLGKALSYLCSPRDSQGGRSLESNYGRARFSESRKGLGEEGPKGWIPPLIEGDLTPSKA
jgi:hypothetical protein